MPDGLGMANKISRQFLQDCGSEVPGKFRLAEPKLAALTSWCTLNRSPWLCCEQRLVEPRGFEPLTC
jgi:hypothetical protein